MFTLVLVSIHVVINEHLLHYIYFFIIYCRIDIQSNLNILADNYVVVLL